MHKPAQPAGSPHESAPDGKRFLRAATEPGQHAFRNAGWAETAQTVAHIVQWAALAKLVALLLSGQHYSETWKAALVIGIAGLLAAALRRLARQQSELGAVAVASALRHQALLAVLPDSGRAPSTQSGAAAYAAFSHIDDIADYCGATEAPRRSMVPAMGLIFVAVALVHWPVAILLAGATALMPGNMRLAGLAGLDASRQRLREMDRLGAVVLESFRGMQALRSLGALERRQAQIRLVAERLNTLTLQVLGKAFLSTLVMDIVVTFAIAVCATYVGLVLLRYLTWSVLPSLSLFSGMFVLLLCPMYFLPLRRMAAGFHARDRAVAAAEAMQSMQVKADNQPTPTESTRLSSANIMQLRTQGLSYQAPDSSTPLFTNLSLTAASKQWTVVTGPSGAGKTTLLSLLSGIKLPQSGAVQWIDVNGDTVEPDVRAAAWIGQSTVIIDGTVASNIMLGNRNADLERVRAAAEKAGLGKLLARLPNGLDTRIGDGGAGVSAGEARRIAIARALLRDASIWFLDEPTAHLDQESERDVLNAIAQASAGRTVIAATHSPELIARANVVWHVGDGQVHVQQLLVQEVRT